MNIILTGYPAFENALRAIRAQVDDFLVKPADIQDLMQLIEQKLEKPKRVQDSCSQPLAACLKQHLDEIMDRALEAMKQHPRLSKLPLSDEERADHIRSMLAEILQQLEPVQEQKKVSAGGKHGFVRRRQGYSLPMLVDDSRAIDAAINSVVRDNLLDLELSTLLQDLDRINQNLDEQLQRSLEAFTAAESAA